MILLDLYIILKSHLMRSKYLYSNYITPEALYNRSDLNNVCNSLAGMLVKSLSFGLIPQIRSMYRNTFENIQDIENCMIHAAFYGMVLFSYIYILVERDTGESRFIKTLYENYNYLAKLREETFYRASLTFSSSS